MNNEAIFTISIFLVTVVLIIWRPFRINEALPASISAVLLLIAGVVPLLDLHRLVGTVGGAAITILSTIVMSIVLESIGFFRWAAYHLVLKSNGSGTRLFWYINLLCFVMTMFFNNDGSILITTPIIIYTLNLLKLDNMQKMPFLLSGALIATSSSAPIGVSNLANLVSLKIVGLDLLTYTTLIFIPAMLGIITIALLLYFILRGNIPERIGIHSLGQLHSPLASKTAALRPDYSVFLLCISIVCLSRISIFVLSPFGIPPEFPSIVGAVLLVAVRYYVTGIGPADVIRKTQWSILVFAFSMYVLVYSLMNIGLIPFINDALRELLTSSSLHAIFVMGSLMTVMSNLLNNLPSIMLATLSLTQLQLEQSTLQLAYLAGVIGADIGSLILPVGTLASLMWMFILRQHNIPITWGHYVRITLIVIPIGLLVSLTSLYLWSQLLFRFQ